MISLRPFPFNDRVLTQGGVVMDVIRRWLQHLERVVDATTQVLGYATARVSASVGATYLRTHDPLTAGFYRVTAAVTMVTSLTGAEHYNVFAEVDTDGVLSANFIMTIGGGELAGRTRSGSTLLTLAAGARLGYSVSLNNPAAPPAIADVVLLIERMPSIGGVFGS